MKIDSVKIAPDSLSIILTLSDAANVTSLYSWTNETYKDYTKLVDLSAKLTGSTLQSITVTLAELNESYFDGVYFFEAQDDNEISIDYVSVLTKYRECIIDRLIAMKGCEDCLKEKDISIINAHSLLSSLEKALELRFIDEILVIIKMLDKYCSSKCNTCGNYNSIQTENNNENFNPSETVLDGGSLD